MDNKDADHQHLKKSSINGAAVNFGTQTFKFGLTFLNQVLLARLLVPEDFGLLAMVAPVIAFVQLFADLGLSQATIQRKEISQAQLSFLFWLNFTAASTLAITVIVLSPLIGWFYHEPRVIKVAAIMGSTFLMSGLYTQHMAIFTRNLQFVKLAFMDLGAFIIGMTAGLTAAWHGWHYWALVTTHVTVYTTNLVFAWCFSTWRPSRPKVPEDWRAMLGFGGNLTGFNLVNYFSRNLDNVLIGKYNGEVALGVYDRAYKLLLLPLTQISQPFSRVAMPLLARMQGDPVLYRRAYLRMIEMIMLLTYPGVLFAIVTHDHLIRTVLGERWAGVAPIFAVLGIGALMAPIGQSTGWLFISQGRAKEMRNNGIVSSTAFVLSFIVGLPWGPLGVAISYISVGMVQGPLLWWAATRKGPVTLQDILGLIKPFAVSAVASVVATFALDRYALPVNIFTLAFNLGISYLVFLFAMLAQPSGRAIVVEQWRHVYSTLVPVLLKVRVLAQYVGKTKQ